jgi:hypothetical protein
LSSGTAGSGSIGIGGFGGGGGDGNTVIFTRTGDTFTNGANSNGVTIQSIGGGGGRGGQGGLAWGLEGGHGLFQLRTMREQSSGRGPAGARESRI